MIFRIKYVKDVEWGIYIPPRQEVRITQIEEHGPYRWKFPQAWMIDKEAQTATGALALAYQEFVEFFDRECINFSEIPLTEAEKEVRIQRFSALLMAGHATKLNGMTCMARAENLAFIDSPQNDGLEYTNPMKRTYPEHLIETAEDYINSGSKESPGDLWMRI